MSTCTVTSDVRVAPWADLLGGRWPSDAAWAQYLTQRAELASAWAEAVATHRAWVRAGRRGEPPGLGTRSLTRAIEWDAAVHAGTVEQGPPPPHWEDEAIATLRAEWPDGLPLTPEAGRRLQKLGLSRWVLGRSGYPDLLAVFLDGPS